ncbi:GspE/PulE family protein [Cysteiniphilum halobium]|uniref:GspE/PulE family protein n=1 Tax=Cysteiniphilum halobium TaxID=2219059 RepID=UPI000E64F73D|nr:ATPase, T2SS/T4P/T4SS family [Cysteiniphilum halobium]
MLQENTFLNLVDNIKDLPTNLILFKETVDWCINIGEGSCLLFQDGTVVVNNKCTPEIKIKIMHILAKHAIAVKKYIVVSQSCLVDLYEFYDINTSQLALNLQDKSQLEIDEDSRIRELLLEIIYDAVRQDVSDVHMEVRKDTSKVRFRINGELLIYRELATDDAFKICYIAFNRESDDVKEHFSPLITMDASMDLELKNNKMIRVRLASIPAYPYPNFDCVMRILTVDTKIPSLLELGYTEDQLQVLQKVIRKKAGAIIVSGATGSGKTTTLASLVSQLPKKSKVYSIEDPIEKKLSNATQVPTKGGELGGFFELTRQTLRMDPDQIVIGEVRDEQTAKIMSRASITGHLVITTIHTNSAINIVFRLLDLGLDLYSILDPNFLLCLVYQTLVKRLCSECKVKDDNPLHIRHFGENIYKRNEHSNCMHCANTGISGRILIAEVIDMGKREFEYIKNNDWHTWQEELSRNNQDIKAKLIDPILRGDVSVEDAVDIADII